jgi:hypothetical protein
MIRRLRSLWTAIAVLLAVAQATGQDPTAGSGPIPVHGGSVDLPAPTPLEADSGPCLPGDAFLEPASRLSPGWFLAVELGVAKPVLRGLLAGSVNGPNQFKDIVILPTVYDWAASPQLELGYRLPENCGEVQLTYRFLISDRASSLDGLNGTGPADMHNHLDLEDIDLDYARHDFSIGPHWDLKWWVGARLTVQYYDTEASNFLRPAAGHRSLRGRGATSGRRPLAHPRLESAVILWPRRGSSALGPRSSDIRGGGHRPWRGAVWRCRGHRSHPVLACLRRAGWPGLGAVPAMAVPAGGRLPV